MYKLSPDLDGHNNILINVFFLSVNVIVESIQILDSTAGLEF